jgi:dethiobiotin synthetase
MNEQRPIKAAANGVFVTGTDTGVGKTLVASALLLAARDAGWRAIGMKPVAAGVNDDGRQEDVEALIAASGVTAPRHLVNPYGFAPPIAPHIAAAEAGLVIDLERIGQAYAALAGLADLVVVEGAGGFLVPLGPKADGSDLARTLALPVVLVVGMRLGCLNHALLTAAAIERNGLRFAGWVANCIDPAMARREANLAALAERLFAPPLAVIPHGSTVSQAADLLAAALPVLTR